MSAIITIRGRLGTKPVMRQTSNGNEMATASIAVTLPARVEEQQTQWFQLIAFGRTAEALGKHTKGDAVCLMGELQLNVWTTKEGVEKRDLQVLVESLMTPRRARVVANGTAKKTQKAKLELEAETAGNPDAFDDEINF